MIRENEIDIAALITCHNRRQKTLAFLDSLIGQQCFGEYQIAIYLLDDGSTDGTAEAVNLAYPFVNIITGSGNLFWAGGMRKIWKYAMAQKVYDLFLLFNDDIILLDSALCKLLQGYRQLDKNGVVITGSTLSAVTHKLSYGGYKLYHTKYSSYYPVEPDENEFIPCQLGNANVLLIDAAAVEKIGIFSDRFTHMLSDFDYTYTAYKAGLSLLIAPGYYAYCENDHGVNWRPAKDYPLKQRLHYLYSPKGLAYKEYLLYIKKHFPADRFSSFVKLWMKTLFPIIWEKFKKGDHNK